MKQNNLEKNNDTTIATATTTNNNKIKKMLENVASRAVGSRAEGLDTLLKALASNPCFFNPPLSQ